MPTIETVEEKIAAGETLSQDDAEALLATSNLTTLGMLGEEARVRRHGDRITFVRVASVPLADAAAGRPAMPKGARELRITGSPTDLETTLASIQAVAAVAAGVPVSGFLLSELETWSRTEGHDLRRILEQFRSAGLELVAEAPLDLLTDADASLDALFASGMSLARLTIANGRDAPLSTFARVSALQRRLNRLHSFAPLPRSGSSVSSTGYDDVKRVAVARLMVDKVRSIQVDWERCGSKLAQVALLFGADDLDAVAAEDEVDLGSRRTSLEDVRRNVRAASLRPVERNGRFEPVDG